MSVSSTAAESKRALRQAVRAQLATLTPQELQESDRALFSAFLSLPQVREGRVVQARVTAVAEKSIRIEVFGVECSVLARDLAWEWICDAHDLYTVGDVILVRIQSIDLSDPSRIRVP